MQTNCNEVVVLQQGIVLLIPAGEELTGRKKEVIEILEKMKKMKRQVKVQFKREPLIIFHSPD